MHCLSNRYPERHFVRHLQIVLASLSRLHWFINETFFGSLNAFGGTCCFQPCLIPTLLVQTLCFCDCTRLRFMYTQVTLREGGLQALELHCVLTIQVKKGGILDGMFLGG